MVGRASSVLSGHRRAAVFVAWLGVLLAYYFVAESLDNLSLWTEVALLAFAIMPAVFVLVWLVLPLERARGLFPLALAFGVLAVLAELGELEILAHFSKLAAMTAFAFWFLGWFQELAWVVLVSLIVPWVDAYSVWRGPTETIIEDHPDVFTTLSFAFPLPGEGAGAALGLPDLLFFALFLASAARFGLRPGWTWLGMVAGLGATIAISVWVEAGGLPGLPALSAGFLLPNADLIWCRLRRERDERRRERDAARPD